MEKIIYLINTETEPEKLFDLVTKNLLPEMEKMNALHVHFAIADKLVKPASSKQFGKEADLFNIYLSFWLPSALQLDGWLASDDSRNLENALGALAISVRRYAVNESNILDPLKQGAAHSQTVTRLPGWQQVAVLCKPVAQKYTDWLQYWLYSHTQIAVEVQSNYGYVQNIVQRALPGTEHVVHGIVGENFPDSAMTSLAEFYDAGDDEAKLARHEAIMMESCAKFLDFTNLTVVPMSAYFVLEV